MSSHPDSRPDLMVRALEGTEAAIRVYRSVGFADHETQLSVHS
jgi:hypothetical protein